MRIFPAIDLLGGQVVRLYQGDYEKKTVYGSDPCEVARMFRDAGARCLHVVDLDGARDGTAANFPAIEALAAQGGFYMEVGGGIRTQERIQQYLDIGVSRCILGTVAVRDFALTVRMGARYGDKIAVGVDMRDGFVSVSGWKETSPERGVEFCRRLVENGIRSVICTDISRDGAEQGTNLALYEELVRIPGLDVTASGGVGSVEELRTLYSMGVRAAVLGKALYAGRLDLATVMKEGWAC